MKPHKQRPLDGWDPIAQLGFHYPIGATFPAPYPVSDWDAARAYCSMWGLPWIMPVKPEIRLSAPHPRSYKPDVSHRPSPTRYLKGQREAFA